MTLVGLCEACRHHRVTGNRRGSIFHLCGRSATDPRFPRYPPLPVLRCAGFEPMGDAEASSPEPPGQPPPGDS